MRETPQQYIVRILGYLDGRDPIEVLESTPAALAGFVSAVDTRTLAKQPAPGKWSIQEILAHLADTEIVMGYRMRRILETNGVAIDAFDQNRWAEIGRYAEVPASESLDRVRSLRRTHVTLLRSLTPAQLAHTGMHAERGPESVAHLSRLWAGHDLNHRAQIEKIVKAST
jgi:uncharacterized damage-inducible protein DinB